MKKQQKRDSKGKKCVGADTRTRHGERGKEIRETHGSKGGYPERGKNNKK